MPRYGRNRWELLSMRARLRSRECTWSATEIGSKLARMQIVVNGVPRDVAPGISVMALLEQLGVNGGPVAVERNKRIVPRAEHGQTALCDGDALEVVQFVGGG
jgi:sulfur carrier protein